ncbi:MAG: sigma-70 family RNA polymerase sigma factor [Planctomycetota bacterium]
MERIADGDETALRALYDATSAQVHGLALAVVRDRSSADEVLVEVFAQVWRQAARYDASRGSVASFLATLTRTRAIDLRRARDRAGERTVSFDVDHIASLRDPAPTPDDASQHAERTARVRHALAALPSEQRRAVEAAFFGGLSHTEVALALDAPLGTVKTRIRAGLERLRRSLHSAHEELS